MSSKIKDIIKSYVFDGIVLILLGIAVIIWADTALKIVFITAGAVLALIGLVKIIVFIANRSGARSAGDLFAGLVELAFGLFVIIANQTVIKYFFIAVGVILLYGAILMFIQAFSLRKIKGSRLVLALVFASLAVAFTVTVVVVNIIADPMKFAKFITVLHGAALIVEGLGMLITLYKIKPAKPSVKADAKDAG